MHKASFLYAEHIFFVTVLFLNPKMMLLSIFSSRRAEDFPLGIALLFALRSRLTVHQISSFFVFAPFSLIFHNACSPFQRFRPLKGFRGENKSEPFRAV